MNVAEYIADFLHKNGIRHNYTLTGGGAMFLNDALGKHEGIENICNHHEQACAMAAVAHAKMTNNYALACVTTGCGATNTITGLLDAWQDNLPCVFISGQIKKKETTHNHPLDLRQIGVQEADIVKIVEPLTKYAVMLNEPDKIRYHLEKALYLAKNGRQGPVWLDIPLDVQGSPVDESQLLKFTPEKHNRVILQPKALDELSEIIHSAERPLILAGNGVRLGGAVEIFRSFIQKHNIPMVSTFLGMDLISSYDDLSIGRVGIKGDRAGNFALQNADLVICMGTRLGVPTTGFEYNLFVRSGKLVVIDIDEIEHQKNTVSIDYFIHADIADVLRDLDLGTYLTRESWTSKCNHWKKKWPTCLKEYDNDNEGINMYYFTGALSNFLPQGVAVVCDAGSAGYVPYQGLFLEEGQRFIIPAAQLEMGFTLPGMIGACVANDKKKTIGITGDGSFMLNIQELQTIVHLNLPVVIFVWNNNGYLSIRSTQDRFFDGRRLGTDEASGVSFPNLSKIADAFGLKYYISKKNAELLEKLPMAMAETGHVLFEVICPENQAIIPTVSAQKREDGSMVSKPFEDMAPFLDRDEFEDEMIVPPLEH
jgi:acetolactate synthase-1/2/3 large subunit